MASTQIQRHLSTRDVIGIGFCWAGAAGIVYIARVEFIITLVCIGVAYYLTRSIIEG